MPLQSNIFFPFLLASPPGFSQRDQGPATASTHRNRCHRNEVSAADAARAATTITFSTSTTIVRRPRSLPSRWIPRRLPCTQLLDFQAHQREQSCPPIQYTPTLTSPGRKERRRKAFEFLQLPAIIVYLIYPPYAKSKGSSTNARHTLVWSLATASVVSSLWVYYDHFAFSGAAPRTFVGPLAAAGLSQARVSGLGSITLSHQLGISRAGNAGPAVYFHRDVVSPRNARSIDCGLAMYVQSICATGIRPGHDDIVCSFPIDPIPPAVLLVLAAAKYLRVHRIHRGAFVSSSALVARRWRRYYEPGARLLTFAAVVFRSEPAILLGYQSIQLVYPWRISLSKLIRAGRAGGTIGLTTTLTMDSSPRQSYTPGRHTPLTQHGPHLARALAVPIQRWRGKPSELGLSP